jgi:OOP family OmpA-OmpF porin
MEMTATPPAPAGRRAFVVYFPLDTAVITPAAADVLRAAAEYDRATQGAHMAVVGFTDTSGSTQYNLALSERRARAVAAVLQGDGVAGDSLEVSWMGKTGLAVPTADGVREPLNRRSTIIVQPAP